MARRRFVPVVKAQEIDWARMRDESDRAKADEARVAAEAIAAAEQFDRLSSDPVAQLVERVTALEARVRDLEAVRGRTGR